MKTWLTECFQVKDMRQGGLIYGLCSIFENRMILHHNVTVDYVSRRLHRFWLVEQDLKIALDYI